MKKEKIKKPCNGCGDEFDAYDLGSLSRKYCDKCSRERAAEEEENRHRAEVEQREAHYRSLIADANIPRLWRDVTFENSNPKLNRVAFKAAKRYAENFNLESGTLVFYSEGYGCGKTHLVACLANHVLHKLRQPVLFKKARDLLLEIRQTFSNGSVRTEIDILNQVLSVELLILDDVGIDNPSPWLESTYWTILDRRLEWQLPTVVTTNYPLEANPGEVCLGDRIGYGALSRLVQLCQGNFLDMSGPDLR